ncbi:MAG TPA: TIGR00730 family Rossman fold protein [Armatimonadaceae bacterium]|nr:TIGR00730 family Rossman fold protein [Armatimonadaceae bacterium]
MLSPAPLRSVCVFCGSSSGERPEYRAAAEATGREIARRGLTLVYGAGNVGLMGAVADAALAADGAVVGVIPQALVEWEVAHASLTELHVTHSMHERKAMMAERADAFLALPGGLGTFEELCEILTWNQLGFLRKPVGLLNVAGYYDGLLGLLDHAVRERFLRPAHRALLLDEPSDPARLLDRLAEFEPPLLDKFIDRDET